MSRIETISQADIAKVLVIDDGGGDVVWEEFNDIVNAGRFIVSLSGDCGHGLFMYIPHGAYMVIHCYARNGSLTGVEVNTRELPKGWIGARTFDEVFAGYCRTSIRTDSLHEKLILLMMKTLAQFGYGNSDLIQSILRRSDV